MLARHGSKIISVAPVMAGGVAYTSGDIVGQVNTLSRAVLDNGGSAKLKSIAVVDKAKQKIAAELWFFSSSPTVPADNAAWDITDALAVADCLGAIAIPATAYMDSASNSLATVTNCELLLQAVAKSQDLYCVLVTRGTPTYAVNDLQIRVGLEQA